MLDGTIRDTAGPRRRPAPGAALAPPVLPGFPRGAVGPVIDERALRDGGRLRLYRGWVAAPADLFARLRDALPLRQETVTVFGRRHPQPRLTSWHADPGCVYRYSGLAWDPAPWTPDLVDLRERLRTELGAPFNSVLVNLYRDGRDSMGWHADDEACFGEDPVIASVSLGAARRFLLRHRSTRETVELELGGGSLLVMDGPTQRFWKHSVPRTTRPVGVRLNLTWRCFVGPEEPAPR